MASSSCYSDCCPWLVLWTVQGARLLCTMHRPGVSAGRRTRTPHGAGSAGAFPVGHEAHTKGDHALEALRAALHLYFDLLLVCFV